MAAGSSAQAWRCNLQRARQLRDAALIEPRWRRRNPDLRTRRPITRTMVKEALLRPGPRIDLLPSAPFPLRPISLARSMPKQDSFTSAGFRYGSVLGKQPESRLRRSEFGVSGAKPFATRGSPVTSTVLIT